MKASIDALCENLLEQLWARGFRQATLEPYGERSSAAMVARVRLLTEDAPYDDDTLYLSNFLPRGDGPKNLIATLPPKWEMPEPDSATCGALLLRGADLDMLDLLFILSDVLEDYCAWDCRILEAIAKRSSLQEVLDIAAEGLANPIALFDSSAALIAYAGALPDGYEDTIWHSVVEQGYAPLSYYTSDERERIGRELMQSSAPYVSYPQREQGHAHASIVGEADGRVLCMLAQVDLIAPFSDGQLKLLEHVRDRICQLLVARGDYLDEQDPLEGCLQKLIVGTPLDDGAMRFHLRRRGWQPDDRFHLICGVVEGDSNEVSLRSIRDRVMQAIPSCVAILLEGAIVAVARAQDLPNDLEQVDRIGRARDVSFGVSSEFRGFSHAPTALLQARDVIEETRGRHGTVAFDDIALLHISGLLKSKATVRELCHPRLLQLVEDDPAHAQDNLLSLHTFLLCGCNVAKAAKRLYMHRNTLEYRLSRMGKLMEMDLWDPGEQEQLRLMVSCLLLLEEMQDA